MNDYTKVATGMAWLGERLPLLDGLGIVNVAATPHAVSFHLDTHDEVRALVADLTEATGIDFAQWERPEGDAHLTFEAENVIDVADGTDYWERLTVRVSAVETTEGDEL